MHVYQALESTTIHALLFSPNLEFSCQDDSYCNGHGTCDSSTCVCEEYKDFNGDTISIDLKDCSSNILTIYASIHIVIAFVKSIKYFLGYSCLGFSEALIKNGVCNNEINNPGCNYDGGDCCVNSESSCYHQETCRFGEHPLVRDDQCNSETNNEACSFDGGDCCLCSFDGGDCKHVNKGHCPSNGIIISHHAAHMFASDGFPHQDQNYGPKLDISWLIQVPSGLYVQINFIEFDLEDCSEIDYYDSWSVTDGNYFICT